MEIGILVVVLICAVAVFQLGREYQQREEAARRYVDELEKGPSADEIREELTARGSLRHPEV
jgi:preprotein translocase subunit YajC